MGDFLGWQVGLLGVAQPDCAEYLARQDHLSHARYVLEKAPF